jgi:amidase
MDNIIFASASELAQAIRDKQLSAQEVVEAHIRRIEAVNPKLNAVVQLTAEAAMAQARAADASLARGEISGPLHGVPITLKDNIEAAGVICTGGTQGRATYIPPEDATVVARMKAAGAILLGKTNLPEFCQAYETDNVIYGRTNNPYDLSRTSGGSSGGESAIIAAGGSPLGLGTDGGGSLRWPAHCCGIATIKPTTGRMPRTGHIPSPGGALDSFWQGGPLARAVADLYPALKIISGPDWRDHVVVPMPLGDPAAVDLKRLRVAFHSDNGIVSPTPETEATIRQAAQALAEAGLTVVEDCPAVINQTHEIYYGLLCADGGAGMQRLLTACGTSQPHPFMSQLQAVRQANALSTADFAALIFRLDTFRKAMLTIMEQYDLILCPVSSHPATPHRATFEGQKYPAYAPIFSYTQTFNMTGWPGAVVRVGTSPEGLPIGVQLVARPWREDVALAVARHLETEFGGWQRPPI